MVVSWDNKCVYVLTSVGEENIWYEVTYILSALSMTVEDVELSGTMKKTVRVEVTLVTVK